MTQIPAGWYPDPAPPQPGQPPLVRYWDGAMWTAHVAPTDPVAAPVPTAPAYGAAPVTPAGPTTPDGQPLAGWWWRVLAQLIDAFTIGVLANIATIPVQLSVQRDVEAVLDDLQRDLEQNPDDPDIAGLLDGMADIYRDNALWLFGPSLVLTVVFVAAFWRWKGATPGKLLLGMRVRLRDRPGTLPWSTITVRLLAQSVLPSLALMAGLLSGSLGVFALAYLVVAVYVLLDALWATWDSKKQTIHDKVARTNVVKLR